MSRLTVIAGNEIKYHVMDPTGNITILVETPVQEASQPFVAAELMRLEPEAEQVGFLTLPEAPGSDADSWDIALRMAGGEFCGNATMSAAAYYAAETGMETGAVTVRVSGAAQPVKVELCAISGGGYRGTVAMPRPLGIREERLPEVTASADQSGQNVTADAGGIVRPIVHFEGIDHVILEETPDRSRAEVLAPLWCRKLNAEAIGLMYLERSGTADPEEPDQVPEEANQFPETDGTLQPLVYVPDAGTLVWENSCASGTSAVGMWVWHSSLQKRQEPAYGAHAIRMTLQEPGGILHVDVDPAGEIRLTGTVRDRTGSITGSGINEK